MSRRTGSEYQQWKKDWNEFLANADSRMRTAVANQLNRASDELLTRIRQNMADVGLHQRTGKLVASLKVRKATTETPRTVIWSEVYAPKPKRPNWNRRLWKQKGWNMNGLNLSKDIRYPKGGVPYGRILEFSPRFNRPFFYKAWYDKRNSIRERIVMVLRNTWQTRVYSNVG